MFAVQRFLRQVSEDGPDPSTKWGKDRAESDTEDPDSEDYMPIPDAGSGPAPGKTPARAPIRDWSDDDDCQILEVLDPRPLAFTFPLHPTSADPDDQVLEVAPIAVGGRAESKKRTGTGTSNAPKKKKKVVSKPRPRPTSDA